MYTYIHKIHTHTCVCTYILYTKHDIHTHNIHTYLHTYIRYILYTHIMAQTYTLYVCTYINKVRPIYVHHIALDVIQHIHNMYVHMYSTYVHLLYNAQNIHTYVHMCCIHHPVKVQYTTFTYIRTYVHTQL